ncbi:MAG: transcription factor S [Candidatus Heimdallarchaeota archaeon]
MFCNKCGTLLESKREEDGTNTVFCPSCGGTVDPKKQNLVMTSKIEHELEKEKTVIIEEDLQSMPIMAQECPKCGNNRVYYWQLQTRRSDEGATTFYRCTKCDHTWREY